ncbi:hypothetical protein KEM48_006978 [Puccinia striiformis f. sp. tritici PST-130]|nr:hypothetical protein KEM48_006978 [Puccinia striiformis f. sp. tritici PST-130]
MPRQPLEDTPGLPPYGKRSSERRKEQNRMAQGLLRERRQQQEAAQALKLLQQQNEIRRLERLITDLRSENLTLRSQSQTRRRQSVIPISSRSKSLAMLHTPTTTSGAGTTLEPNYKPFLGRHSIDYSSLHGAESILLIHPIACMNVEFVKAGVVMTHPSGRAARLSTCTSQDTKTQAHSNNEEASPTNSFCAKTHTPPIREAAGESRTNTWANSAQMVEQSSQINSASNTGIVLPSVNLASFWPAQPSLRPFQKTTNGSSDANSLATNSHNHSSFSTSSFASFQFPFISPELGSMTSPFPHHPQPSKFFGSAIRRPNLSEINAPICFGSPFSESNDSEINVQSNFDVTMTWIEPNGYNVET